MPVQSSFTPDFTGARVDRGRMLVQRRLGAGAYGVVYAARPANDPCHPFVAVKILNKSNLAPHALRNQQREIRLHSRASIHPNVVTIFRSFEESNCLFVVLEYQPAGDLFSMITEKHLYIGKDLLIKKVFMDLVGAVEFCHRKGVYHRDLKPENILCREGGAGLLLSDFGLATSEPWCAEFGCGSSYYMSPECQGTAWGAEVGYDTRANDIWPLGVILVNLACGRNPWRQASPLDDTYAAYLRDPTLFRSIIPISTELDLILRRIFTPASERMKIRELRLSIQRVSRFTMTDEELADAPRACREAAAATAEAAKRAGRDPIGFPSSSCRAESTAFIRSSPIHTCRVTENCNSDDESDEYGGPEDDERAQREPNNQDDDVPDLSMAGNTAPNSALPTPETRAIDPVDDIPRLDLAPPKARDPGLVRQLLQKLGR